MWDITKLGQWWRHIPIGRMMSATVHEIFCYCPPLYNWRWIWTTSKLGELWSPARQQLWPWRRSRSRHGVTWNGLSQGPCMPNINALSLILQKIWVRLKILWQTDERMRFNVPTHSRKRGTITDFLHNTIYVSAHRCAGGMKKKFDLRSGF